MAIISKLFQTYFKNYFILCSSVDGRLNTALQVWCLGGISEPNLGTGLTNLKTAPWRSLLQVGTEHF